MSKIIRSPRVFSALLNVTEEKNMVQIKDVAMDEYDHQPIQYFTIDHELTNSDESIKFDVRMSYEMLHTLEAEGEFTPADHNMDLTGWEVIRAVVWLGEEEFRIPITKEKTKLLIRKMTL